MIDAQTSLSPGGDYPLSTPRVSAYPPFASFLIVGGFVLIALAVWGLNLAVTSSLADGVLARVRDDYRSRVPSELRTYVWLTRTLLLNPYMYLAVAAVFWLEKRIPANRTQPTFSPGLWQDFVWFVADNITFRMIALPLMLSGLDFIFVRYAPFMQIQSLKTWPAWVQIPLWFLLVDFTQFSTHLARHKIPFFWRFHAVHHSPADLNVFSDSRQHLLDRLMLPFFVFIFLRMLGIEFTPAVWVTVLLDWHSRIVHSNLRTNFGPLKFLIVSPQYHRVHHSIESRHRDVNLSAWFTIWDRLFGTISANYDEYPTTGIHDSDFPLERQTGIAAVSRNYVRQTVYPFRINFGRRSNTQVVAESDPTARAV